MTTDQTQTMTANNPTEADHEGEQSGENENAPIRHIQTVPVRFNGHVTGEGQFTVGITPSIRAAGLDADGMFRYTPEDVDNLGLVPALGFEDGKGQMRDGRTYSVHGNKGEALRLEVPNDALEALDIDPDEAKTADSPPLLDVYVGDYLLAFDRSDAIPVPTDALPDDYEGDTNESDEVVLHQAQTTTPKMRSWGGITARLTAGIRQAGNGAEDDLGAIKYLPELSDDLGGDVVPAIVTQDGDGRVHDNTYSLSRIASNSGKGSHQGFEANIPDNVLDVLGFSADDYEDVPLENRPALTVYAGDHLLAFGRPGAREVVVDRSQTPDQRTPGQAEPTTLTDIAGIGDALANELHERGFETVADLADADREELLEIDQLGENRADDILDDVNEYMDEDGEDR